MVLQALFSSGKATFLRASLAKCEELAHSATAKSPELTKEAPDPSNQPTDTASLPVKKIVPSPVSFENFSREWSFLSQQDNFDGFRVEAAKTVTQALQTSHTLFLATQLAPEGYMYQVGPTYTSADQNTFLMGRWGVGQGSLSVRGMQKLPSYGLELKAQVQSSLKDPARNAMELSMDKTGQDWAATAKVVHHGTWIVNGAFSQEITQNLALGGELSYIPANKVSIGVVGGRWVCGPDYVVASLTRAPNMRSGPMFSTHSGKAQYVRKVSDRLSIGAEVEVTSDLDSSLQVGYDYVFRSGRVQGLADSGGKVSCYVQDAQGFGVSGVADFFTGDYKFGFMMHFLPPTETDATNDGSA